MSCVTFGTPAVQITGIYPDFQPLFKWGHQISTQLPKNIAQIRAVASVAFSCLVAFILKSSFLTLPIITVGIAFAGWTIYSHILSKDLLLEAFYKIFKTKEAFEKLPTIKIQGGTDAEICEEIMELEWDTLQQPVTLSSTPDGRRIILVKGSRYQEEQEFEMEVEVTKKTTTHTIFAYIEKINEERSDIAIGHALLGFDKGNTFFRFERKFDEIKMGNILRVKLNNHEISSSISSDMLNEIAAQRQVNFPLLDWNDK